MAETGVAGAACFAHIICCLLLTATELPTASQICNGDYLLPFADSNRHVTSLTNLQWWALAVHSLQHTAG
jgi:hypothetical protein